MSVDRDSTRGEHGNEGFDIRFSCRIGRGGFTIHFEDEADAADLARMILERLGLC